VGGSTDPISCDQLGENDCEVSFQFNIGVSNSNANGSSTVVKLTTILEHFSSFSADVVDVQMSDLTCPDAVRNFEIPDGTMIAPGNMISINGTMVDVNICLCPQFVFTVGGGFLSPNTIAEKRKTGKGSGSHDDVCAAVTSIVSLDSSSTAPSVIPFPSVMPSMEPSSMPSMTPSILPSQMPSPEPLTCKATTIPNLINIAPTLNSTFIDCLTLDVEYTDPGQYIVQLDTLCSSYITFSGVNQVVDCQGKMLNSSASTVPFLTFRGNGPYIVKNCTFSGSSGIFVNGTESAVSNTIDILVEDSSITGTKANGQVGVGLSPSRFRILCAEIRKTVISSMAVGIAALAQADERILLDISDVSTMKNTVGGTSIQGFGGLAVARISGQNSIGDRLGLSASGQGAILNVSDSTYCASTETDVTINTINRASSFSNNTCTSTSTFPPTSSIICSQLCD
jgi:hypothetical protein